MYQLWWLSRGGGEDPKRAERRRLGQSRMTSGQIVMRQEAIMMVAPSTTVRMPSLTENPALRISINSDEGWMGMLGGPYRSHHSTV